MKAFIIPLLLAFCSISAQEPVKKAKDTLYHLNKTDSLKHRGDSTFRQNKYPDDTTRVPKIYPPHNGTMTNPPKTKNQPK